MKKEQSNVLRTAIYIRVSTDQQAKKGDSVDAQLDTCREYVEKHDNLVLYDTYVDDGVSGQKIKRGDFSRLMNDVRSGQIDLIIFTKLDRWFRSLRHYLNTQATLEANHCAWLAVDQPYFDTSTPHGRAFVAQSMTFAELEKLDVGSWFSPEYEGTRIPSLSEVLELCSQKIGLNVEIKYVGKNSELPEKTAEMIKEYGMENQCVITSTNLSYLKRVKEVLPEIRTGYIISAAYGNFYSNEDVDFISIRSGFVTSALMQNAHEQGKAVYAWTVNTKSERERLTLLGVDGIITDRPVLAREICYRGESMESLLEYLKLVLR